MPAIFIVVSLTPAVDHLVEESVKKTFPNNCFTLDRGKWLVAADGTSRNVSDILGITGKEPPTLGSTMVFTTAGYYGRASTEIWEWIASKLGGHLVG